MIAINCDNCAKAMGTVCTVSDGEHALVPIRLQIQDSIVDRYICSPGSVPPPLWAKHFCSHQCCSDWLMENHSKMWNGK